MSPLPSILLENRVELILPSRGALEREATSVGAEPEARSLNVIVPEQDQDNWCWAAVSAGLARFWSDALIDQCVIANRVLQIDACPPGVNPQADQPSVLEKPLEVIRAYNGTFMGIRDFNYVRSQIDAGYPVACRIQWANGLGHFVVIAGYVNGRNSHVEVRDPLYGSSTIPFDEFASHYQQYGRWERTYDTSRPSNDREHAVHRR